MEPMVDDKRKIGFLAGPEGIDLSSRLFFVVGGGDGVTRIEAYWEPSPNGATAWFAVWAGDRLRARVNSTYVESVGYEEGGA